MKWQDNEFSKHYFVITRFRDRFPQLVEVYKFRPKILQVFCLDKKEPSDSRLKALGLKCGLKNLKLFY